MTPEDYREPGDDIRGISAFGNRHKTLMVMELKNNSEYPMIRIRFAPVDVCDYITFSLTIRVLSYVRITTRVQQYTKK